MLKVLSLTLALITTSASFGEVCQITSQPLKAYYQASSFEMNCAYFDSLQRALDEATLLNNEVSSDQFTLVLSRKGSNAGFDHGTIIEAPYRFVFYGPYGEEFPVDFHKGVEILNHEYGHFLFKNYFLESFPEFQNLFESFDQLSALRIEILETNDTDKKLLLKNTLQQLMNEIGKSKEFQTYNKIASPYNELFADLLASLVSKDKAAMMKALYYDKMSDFQYNYVRTRSFDTTFGQSDEVYMSDEHGFMAYTRSFIGANLWPDSISSSQKLIKKLKEAMTQSMKKDFERGQLLNYKKQNEQLIELLKN